MEKSPKEREKENIWENEEEERIDWWKITKIFPEICGMGKRRKKFSAHHTLFGSKDNDLKKPNTD